MRSFTYLIAATLLAGTLLAQNVTGPSLGPDGDTRVSINGIGILPVIGKPFSGSDSVDWTRTLEDGSIVATHQDAKLARDSQGRIYRENVTRFAANSDQKSRVKEFIIMDPAAHTRTACVIAARQCNLTGYNAPARSIPQPTGSFDEGKRSLSRESLGTDTINGLQVVGTRETLTINAGVEGNSQPLSSTQEFWYSPDLEVNLSVTRKDPREATVAIHVVDLSRSDPDPSLFQIPANFLAQDQRRSAKSEN